MTKESAIPVFVYGTLKRGFPNYDESRLGASFYGKVRSLEAFPLVVANRYYSPVLIDEPGSGSSVYGELFCVSQSLLDYLDEIESVGRPGGYHRSDIDIRLANDEIISAFAYFKYRSDLEVIHSGPLSEYPLDERYVPAERR
ncbi:MAG: gamma-glutamylcyclotransferase family protein [Pseudomonadota bacterium]